MKVRVRGPIAAFLSGWLNWLPGGAWLRMSAVSMSGQWCLSLEDSDFGSGQVPRGIEFLIEHCEPSISFRGVFTTEDGESIPFEEESVLDNRPKIGANGDKIRTKRLDPFTLICKRRSFDCQIEETATMRVLPGGEKLVVERRANSPSGTFQSTEVYLRHKASGFGVAAAPKRAWTWWVPVSLEEGERLYASPTNVRTGSLGSN
jgi:hypothetical protein